jgi:hypothetical protein
MINAEFYMISGSLDEQKSDDVFDVNKFQLPYPAGKSGGAATTALLKVLYANELVVVTWVWLVQQMKLELKRLSYSQIPMLSSSRKIDIKKEVVYEKKGTKRALLIGINYRGQIGELYGCHNDIRNIKRFLKEVHSYEEKNMLILMDDGKSMEPTRKNIENAFVEITKIAKSGDVVWIHYAGHGERVIDESRDEKSGVDSTLVPVDFRISGEIKDDDIYKLLVKPMPSNVEVSVITDCCHSGTLLDLPYKFRQN